MKKLLGGLVSALFFVSSYTGALELSSAILSNNVQKVRSILGQDDIASLDSALLQAVGEGKVAIVELLLLRGIQKISRLALEEALVVSVNRSGFTDKDRNITRILLNSIDYGDVVLTQAVIEALSAGNEQAATFLLTRGADIDSVVSTAVVGRLLHVIEQFPEHLSGAIEKARYGGDIHVVSDLLEKGLDTALLAIRLDKAGNVTELSRLQELGIISKNDLVQRNVLRAVEVGDVDKLEKIIGEGSAGRTVRLDLALQQAIKWRRFAVVEFLLSEKNDTLTKPGAWSHLGLKRALELLIGLSEADYSKGGARIAQRLLVIGRFEPDEFANVLAQALTTHNLDVARRLVAAGADIGPFLDKALQSRSVELLQQFPEYVVDALVRAKAAGDEHVAQALLDAGLDTISMATELGKTRNFPAYIALRDAFSLDRQEDHLLAFGIAAKIDSMRMRFESLPKERAPLLWPDKVSEHFHQTSENVSGRNSSISVAGKPHYPIEFIIESSDSEAGLLWKEGFGSFWEVSVADPFKDANSVTLLMQVLGGSHLLISSRALTCALISLAQREDYVLVKEAIDKKWSVYSVPETQFTTWVPKQYAQHYGQVLRLDSFERLVTGTKKDILQHCPPALVFRDDSRINTLHKAYHKDDLYKIFDLSRIQQETDIFDVFIDGHGVSGVEMAGLPIAKDVPEAKRITSLLSFLSSKLNTGVVYIESCEAGGQNVGLAQTGASGVLIDYNYVLIISAISDKLTFSRLTGIVEKTNEFFDFAVQLPERGQSALKDFMSTISFKRRAPIQSDIRGYAAFPQVWLPGWLGFQGRDVAKDVFVVGNVPARVWAQEGGAVEVQHRQIVLWYPKIIDAPVEVFPAKINMAASSLSPNRLGDSLRTAEELLADSRLRLSEVMSMPYSFPTLLSLLHVHGEAAVQGWIEQAKMHLYPELILMGGTAQRRLWLKKVVVKDGGNPFMGWLRFLRDSFGNVGIGVDQKDILIESLEGINDLRFYVESAAYVAIAPIPWELKEMVHATATPGQKITLENVMIRINSPEHPGYLVFYIPFGGEYWSYKVPLDGQKVDRVWNFQRADAPPIDAFKKSLAEHMVDESQKSAREILRQKAEWLKMSTPEQWFEFKERMYPVYPH